MSVKVFISYSRRDFRFARDLAQSLRDAQIDFWLDVAGIQGSERWNSKIESALMECTHFLIVVSPYSLKSPQVQREFNKAIESHKPIVPALLQTTELDERLRDIEYIDFRVNYGIALAKLVNFLHGQQPKTPDWLEIPPKPTSYRWNPTPLLFIVCPRSVKAASTLVMLSAGLKMLIGFGAILDYGSDGAVFGSTMILMSLLGVWEMFRAANRRAIFGEVMGVESTFFCFPLFPLFADTPIWQFLITSPLDIAAAIIMFSSKSFRRWMIAYPYGLGAKN